MLSKPNISRIIYVVESIFTERDYVRYGIKTLIDRGADVAVFDLTAFFSPHHHFSTHQVPREVFPNIIQFKEFTQIKSAVKNLTCQDCVLLCFPFNLKTKSIFKLFDKQNLFYGIGNQNILPRPGLQKKRSWLEKINFGVTLFYKHPSSFINFIYAKIPSHMLSIKKGASFIILGGNASNLHSPIIKKSTQKIFIHSFDYDSFLRAKNRPAEEKNEIVFLDQYLPYHFEWEILGYKSPAPAGPYYQNLRDLFSYLEKIFQVKIVIAAHPHADYHTKKDCFDGYEIFSGKSIELIQRSKLILAHSSTAINFAVLFRKPISLITDQYLLKNISFQSEIEQMAHALGREIIQIEKKEYTNWEKELKIDESRYSEYQKKYIKIENSPQKAGWEIFADFLQISPKNSQQQKEITS